MINVKLSYLLITKDSVYMDLSNEEMVTELLTNREILKRQDAPEVFEDGIKYSTNPKYDLSNYLASNKPKSGRFGDKYLFVT